jgi:hypothetical protein
MAEDRPIAEARALPTRRGRTSAFETGSGAIWNRSTGIGRLQGLASWILAILAALERVPVLAPERPLWQEPPACRGLLGRFCFPGMLP